MEECGLEKARTLQRKCLGLAERRPRASSRWMADPTVKGKPARAEVQSSDQLGLHWEDRFWKGTACPPLLRVSVLTLVICLQRSTGITSKAWDTRGTRVTVIPHGMITACS